MLQELAGRAVAVDWSLSKAQFAKQAAPQGAKEQPAEEKGVSVEAKEQDSKQPAEPPGSSQPPASSGQEPASQVRGGSLDAHHADCCRDAQV